MQLVWLVVDVTISMQLVKEGCVNVKMVSFIPMVIVVSKSELSKLSRTYYLLQEDNCTDQTLFPKMSNQ